MARTNTREEIIRKGAELIHAQGYNATGLQQILQAANIPKGSFYFYFKSKEDFGMEVIDYFSAIINEIFTKYLSDKKIPPMKRLEKLFKIFEDIFQKSGYSHGCPIGNLSLELADTNERLRLHLGGVIEKLIAQIESCLKEAQAEGSIPMDLNTADTAHFIFHGFEGAVLHMKVVKSIEPFHAFRNNLLGYLNDVRQEVN
ncbi:MAG TPA: TetR family transcriptional regulator C-terminal domain-containing protein [Smithellaceae bacterium]|nr:TetR family transcriptional regulator C-terminal domain-containing protein [Smithellaceae bacterium]